MYSQCVHIRKAVYLRARKAENVNTALHECLSPGCHMRAGSEINDQFPSWKRAVLFVDAHEQSLKLCYRPIRLLYSRRHAVRILAWTKTNAEEPLPISFMRVSRTGLYTGYVWMNKHDDDEGNFDDQSDSGLLTVTSRSQSVDRKRPTAFWLTKPKQTTSGKCHVTMATGIQPIPDSDCQVSVVDLVA